MEHNEANELDFPKLKSKALRIKKNAQYIQ